MATKPTVNLVTSISTTTAVASGSVILVLNALGDILADVNAGKYSVVEALDQLLVTPSQAKRTKLPARDVAEEFGKAYSKLSSVLTEVR